MCICKRRNNSILSCTRVTQVLRRDNDRGTYTAETHFSRAVSSAAKSIVKRNCAHCARRDAIRIGAASCEVMGGLEQVKAVAYEKYTLLLTIISFYINSDFIPNLYL